MIAQRFEPFGTTIFSEMTRLAEEHDAVNLAQGFPDFDGPREIVDAAVDAMNRGHNQYARSMGHPQLVQAIAQSVERHRGLSYDPLREVLVFSGATEGIASAMLGLVNPGDEVILFEPFYDSYPAAVAMAGGVVRTVPLRFPDFALDVDQLARTFNERTKLVVLNTPHNPTGKVFERGELEAIARLCIGHDVLALCDEVYEHLTYDGATHLSLASMPGMRERTLTLSSSGKTFSLTGWKIGWGTGPAPMIAAAQAAHQFTTFATATPLQVGIAQALATLPASFYDGLRAEYDARRRFMLDVLRESGFTPATPRGTYFVLASFERLSDQDDRAFTRELVVRHRIAAIPPSAFYLAAPEEGRRLVRFAFCKKRETLELAAERLLALRARA